MNQSDKEWNRLLGDGYMERRNMNELIEGFNHKVDKMMDEREEDIL